MDKRQHATIRVPPGGVVADYVPFYFGPKSPMLYAIKQGKVEGYQGQREIIYLLAHAEEVETAKLPFAFTDGHAIISYVNHYNQLADLSKLDWNAIRAQYWNNLVDGRCRRQAEFLIKDRFPMDLLREIGVMDDAAREAVSHLAEQTSFRPLIQVHREWYF
jgi:ssDNA thymidine ADP-ribosyltransferase, DarT